MRMTIRLYISDDNSYVQQSITASKTHDSMIVVVGTFHIGDIVYSLYSLLCRPAPIKFAFS